MDDQKRVGPLEEQEFFELVSRGRISDNTLVWKEGMAEWLPYARANTHQTPAPDVASVDAGGAAVATAESLLSPLQEGPITASFQRSRPGTEVDLAYAGFGPRFVAKMIDVFVMTAVFVVFGVAMAVFIGALVSGGASASDPGELNGLAIAVIVVWYAASLFAPIAYNAYFVAKSGATPGKKAMGLKVVRANGKNVTTGQAWGRAFADLLSQMTMYVGYLLIIFDDEKRSLHDHVCGTRVIGKR